MCRLLASLSETPHRLDDLADDQLSQFRAIANLHGDGWGVAWRDANHMVNRYRNAMSAAHDPFFSDYASSVASDAHLVHTRWASAGFPVLEANAHPFFAEGIAFAHNGFIRDSERLEAYLGDTDLGGEGLDTDSKRYFALVLERSRQTGSLEAGLVDAIAIIRDTCGVAGTNAMVLSEDQFICAHAWAGARVPIDLLADRAGGIEHLPPGHDENYYVLSTRRVNGVFQIASTGLVDGGWTALSGEGFVVVDRGSNHARFSPIDGGTSVTL
jgi:predicted glutamine amidotransferase